MPSNSRREAHRRRRAKQREWRATALAEIGFTSMAELARAADVYDADLSGIAKGTRKPCDRVADRIICAIQERNYDKGWTYMQAALHFREAFDYLRGNFANQDNRPAILLSKVDVDRWCANHIDRLARLQADLDEPLSVIAVGTSLEASLDNLLSFAQSWEMKHDFDLLAKVKRKFNTHLCLVTRPTILQGMKAERYYDRIKSLYTEIRHIAHLCGALDLVNEMSDWLRVRAEDNGDIQTEVQVKVTQAWMLTSRNTQESLFKAQALVQDVQQAIQTHRCLETLPVEHADIVAILAELRLRLAIRLAKQRRSPLDIEEFEALLSASKQLLFDSESFRDSTPRLKSRYLIPLYFQNGIYLHHIQDYEGAQIEFERIINKANCIGWTRVEQAAYTWLATQLEMLGDRDRCTKVLDKVNVLCLEKRQLLSQRMRARIASEE